MSKPEHIKWISANVPTANTKQYKFKNDISLNEKDHTSIGESFTKFSGKIDGNGKSFKEAKIVANSYAGFIGYMSGGEIKNLTIDSSVEINVSAYNLGAVVGCLSGGTIINCVNKADITNTSGNISYVGGIVGQVWRYTDGSSYIYSSANHGYIYLEKGYAGGIIGYFDASDLSSSGTYIYSN